MLYMLYMPSQCTNTKQPVGHGRPRLWRSFTTSSESNCTNSRHSSESSSFDMNSLFTYLEQDVEATTSNDNAHNRNSPSRSCSGCSDRDYRACLLGQTSNSPESDLENGNPLRIPDFLKNIVETPPCEVHLDAEKLYCYTCSKPLCRDCGIQQHEDHVTNNLMEAVKDAQAQAKEVLQEVILGIRRLEEELDATEMAKGIVQHHSKQAEVDMMLTVVKATAIAEKRQKQLLANIQNAMREQLPVLNSARLALKKKLVRLSFVCDILSEAMEIDPEKDHPLCLSIITDMAIAEIDDSDETSASLSPEENEQCIEFSDIESNFQNVVPNFGESIDNQPGTIGDRRLQRNSINTNLDEEFHSGPWPMPSVSKPRETTRTHPFPVTVRMYRNSEVPVKPSKIIGTGGDVLDNLCRPWGIACDQKGYIIVADRSNNRIQIYRQDGSLVRRFGSIGTAPGQFQRPAGVAVDSRRRIIVADKDNHRIQIFTMEGLFLLAFGEIGKQCGQFNYPWDVAVNYDCQIIVSDTKNHRIQLFTAEGIFLQKYGPETSPNTWEQFDCPRGVAFDTEGNVAVTDFNNHKVITVNSDFEDVHVFQCEATGVLKSFRRPQGIVIDDAGNVIVADSKRHRIQIFNKDGQLKWSYGSLGQGESEMDRPAGVALCPDGRIAVVDFGNNRVLLI
ncbi:E3 ubiquitin-protein ligase TRIM71-like [Ceratina calcarata]|uniref:E3 ubiquitin-protein ligase TRIM71-like n=1 Tax=Ceratina calcarata TaxID=156304 RepID=A0AAJ7ITC7_9HYME|nr:E3 ubiquitin-protein ligase TRIM71-like [Ceratina calcarata]